MRSVLLAVAVVLTSVPAFAGGFTLDLPHLTWPADPVSPSTKNCVPGPTGVCR